MNNIFQQIVFTPHSGGGGANLNQIWQITWSKSEAKPQRQPRSLGYLGPESTSRPRKIVLVFFFDLSHLSPTNLKSSGTQMKHLEIKTPRPREIFVLCPINWLGPKFYSLGKRRSRWDSAFYLRLAPSF